MSWRHYWPVSVGGSEGGGGRGGGEEGSQDNVECNVTFILLYITNIGQDKH